MLVKDKTAAGAALRIVFIYLVVAGSGFALINLKTIASHLGPHPFFQEILFLCLTALLLFFLIYRLYGQLCRSNRRINDNDDTEKKQLQEKLEQSQVALTLQNAIITQFLTTDDDSVYQLVLQVVLEALHSKYGCFGYLNHHGNLICPNLPEKSSCSSENLEDISAQAIREGKTILKNSNLVLRNGQRKMQNELVVPVLYEEKVIGLFYFADKERDYSAGDVALLEHICSSIAPILNARLRMELDERLRIKADLDLTKSEISLKEAEKIAGIGHWEFDHRSGRLSWSDEIYHIFCVDPEKVEVDYVTFLKLVHPDDRDMVDSACHTSLEKKTPYEITHRLLMQDGSVKHVHERGHTRYNQAGEPQQSFGTTQDVSGIIEAKESNHLLVTAIEQASDVVVITDYEGTIEYVNPAFEQMTGYTRQEVMGGNSRILQSGEQTDEFYCELWAIISSGQVWRGRFINKSKTGELFTEEATISPVLNKEGIITNYVAVKHDITREQELEQQLRQAVKMETIGTLAGGIAHDFNNILGSILGYTRMAMDDLSPECRSYQDLEKVLLSGDRAADLVKQILLFSSRQEHAFIPVRIQILVKEVVKMLRASLPASIVLKMKIEPGCPPVMGDPTQIHQILLNLCTNAKQAMLAEGGILTITLSEQGFDDQKHLPLELKPGRYITLRIMDTGGGIAKDTLTRIFDPFFTTKGRGEGSGLGLAVVHGIVKSHHGAIIVESQLEYGTEFTVFLPVAGKHIHVPVFQDTTIPRGKEHIMVVDDEADILHVRRRMLTGLGYKVTTFSRSTDALASFQKSPFHYDLLLTDMTMPDMDGSKLTQKVRALRPDLPVILCTGYSEVITRKKALEQGIQEFLLKPINKVTLAQTIRKVFDNGSNSNC